MAKRLFDEEAINKAAKAIEVHLKIIEEANINLGSVYEKERMEKSIYYLEEALNLLRPFEDEIKKSKKEAYLKYKRYKEELELYKRSSTRDPEVEAELNKKVDSYLKLYLAFKGEYK